MPAVTLYGIASCDTVRKCRKTLEAAGYSIKWRDLRADPLSAPEWSELLARFGDGLINRRSTSWREMSETERRADPATLLAAHPTVMKRPVLVSAERSTCGWSRDIRAKWVT